MIPYQPDRWIIVKIKGTDPHYRIFASWLGGYLDGDSWKLNSGIVNIKEDDNFYYFDGHSGSIYKCHKKSYGQLGSYNTGIINSLCERSGDTMECLYEIPQDIMTMNFIIK